MIELAGMEFAQVRLQVVYAARPDDAAWREIEAARGLAAFLEVARKAAFQQLAGVPDGDVNIHALEVGLRARWRANVLRIASWLPGAWQPAVHWCATLPDLVFIDHLLRGHPAPPWLQDDTALRGLAGGGVAQRRAALAAGPLAPLAAPAASVLDLWRAELRVRMLGVDSRRGSVLDLLVRGLGAGGGSAIAAGAAQLGQSEDRESRLRAIFRGAAMTPLAAVALVALLAQDFRRFRGQLARRAALPDYHPAL